MAEWHTMRASDADRERAADVLKAGLAEGRIDLAEHDRRVTALMTAKTYGAIHRLVADLPAGPTPFPTPAVPGVGPPQSALNPWAAYAPVPVPPRRTETLATASLVLGALTPLTGGMTSIPAIVTGHLALARLRNSDDDGRGLAIAGLVLGYLTVLLGLVMVVAIVVGVMG